MRVDVERHQPQSGKRGRIDDRHVIGRVDAER